MQATAAQIFQEPDLLRVEAGKSGALQWRLAVYFQQLEAVWAEVIALFPFYFPRILRVFVLDFVLDLALLSFGLGRQALPQRERRLLGERGVWEQAPDP
jgi:hypothetical protein